MPWILVGLAVAFAVAVRDSFAADSFWSGTGEFAYGGQLMLQGIPPYKLVYSMKFPGMYTAYAAIMAVFGQTIAGIHVGFILVNAADPCAGLSAGKAAVFNRAGVAAAAAYALMSLGAGVLGAQAHATHFVVIAALGGTLLLLRGINSGRWYTLLGSGELFGVAVLMKQHGALWSSVLDCLAWIYFTSAATPCSPGREGSGNISRRCSGAAGADRPGAMVGGRIRQILVLDVYVCARICAGSFASRRADHVPHILSQRRGAEPFDLDYRHGRTGAIWLRKENRVVAVFSTSFLIFSFLAVCPGLYFCVNTILCSCCRQLRCWQALRSASPCNDGPAYRC